MIDEDVLDEDMGTTTMTIELHRSATFTKTSQGFDVLWVTIGSLGSVRMLCSSAGF